MPMVQFYLNNEYYEALQKACQKEKATVSKVMQDALKKRLNL